MTDTWPKHDGSRWGRFRDNLARGIATFALDRIATPWYAKMIAGSIRMGLTAARDEEASQRVFKLAGLPWKQEPSVAGPGASPAVEGAEE